jgi:hypothetical protein
MKTLNVPSGFIDARLTAHWASQVVAAASSLLPAEDDFSQMSMVWSPEEKALLGRGLPAAGGTRCGLRIRDLTLFMMGDKSIESELHLEGKSLDNALGWLVGELKARRASGLPERPTHELPPHPAAEGAAFGVDSESLLALSDWFDAAHHILRPIQRSRAGASQLRCWPHHFDIATLLDLGDGKSVGLGLSPGDASYPGPYWYGAPWPHPAEGTPFPDLRPAGHWHTDGFTGAILTVEEGGQDVEKAQEFLLTAEILCRQIAGS